MKKLETNCPLCRNVVSYTSVTVLLSHLLKILSLFEMSQILFCLTEAATAKGYLMLK